MSDNGTNRCIEIKLRFLELHRIVIEMRGKQILWIEDWQLRRERWAERTLHKDIKMESLRQLGDIEDSESPVYMCYKLRKEKIQRML